MSPVKVVKYCPVQAVQYIHIKKVMHQHVLPRSDHQHMICEAFARFVVQTAFTRTIESFFKEAYHASLRVRAKSTCRSLKRVSCYSIKLLVTIQHAAHSLHSDIQ